MKLLFDANLSPALATALSDPFSGSAHVFDHHDIASDDLAIWAVAAQEGFTIVTKDTDFLDLGLLRGAPPKAIILRIGNVKTEEVEALLRARAGKLIEFEAAADEAVLIVHR